MSNEKLAIAIDGVLLYVRRSVRTLLVLKCVTLSLIGLCLYFAFTLLQEQRDINADLHGALIKLDSQRAAIERVETKTTETKEAVEENAEQITFEPAATATASASAKATPARIILKAKPTAGVSASIAVPVPVPSAEPSASGGLRK